MQWLTVHSRHAHRFAATPLCRGLQALITPSAAGHVQYLAKEGQARHHEVSLTTVLDFYLIGLARIRPTALALCRMRRCASKLLRPLRCRIVRTVAPCRLACTGLP